MSLEKQMTFSKAEKDLIRLGRKQAEQRIIKLLEDFDKENASCQCCFTELCVNDAIALIKGQA